MGKKRHLRHGRKAPFTVALYVLFGLLAVVTIFPFYNTLILSVANTISYATHSPYILPYTLDWAAYREILHDRYFLSSLKVTIFVTVVGTGLNMLLSTMTAYVLSRKQLLGRKFLTGMLLFTMLFSGGLVPTYLLVANLGLLDSVWSMILPSLLNTYYVFIMKNYFLTLPTALEEAARIDGANDFQILFRVYIPIARPFMATFALFYAVERWNEWWNAYLYIIDKELKPLQIYLKDILITYNTQLAPQLQAMLESQQTTFPTAVHMATIIVTMVPILCVYPFMQKHFVKGVMLGSVKE